MVDLSSWKGWLAKHANTTFSAELWLVRLEKCQDLTFQLFTRADPVSSCGIDEGVSMQPVCLNATNLRKEQQKLPSTDQFSSFTNAYFMLLPFRWALLWWYPDFITPSMCVTQWHHSDDWHFFTSPHSDNTHTHTDRFTSFTWYVSVYPPCPHHLYAWQVPIK